MYVGVTEKVPVCAKFERLLFQHGTVTLSYGPLIAENKLTSVRTQIQFFLILFKFGDNVYGQKISVTL